MLKRIIKSIFNRNFIKQVLFFGLAGGTTAIIEWALLAVFVKFFDMNPLVGNVVAFCISSIYNFWANRKFVFHFDENKSSKKIFAQFMLLSVIGLGINELVLYIGSVLMDYDPMLVKLVGIVLAAIFNFFSRKILLEKRISDNEKSSS